MTKYCKGCDLTKDVMEFYPRRRKNKKNGMINLCKICSKKEVSNRRTLVRQLCFDYINMQNCQYCKYDTYKGALEFHHTDPTKKDLNIAKIRTKNLTNKHKKELSKCIVLCANCHRKEHNKFDTLIITPIAKIGRKCTRCTNTRFEYDYYKGHAICKYCYNEVTTFKHRKRKEQSIVYKGGKCFKCNESELRALDFHHLNNYEKETGISKLSGGSFENHIKELDKCVLLCANHHREVHHTKEILVDTFIAKDSEHKRIKEIEQEIFKYKTTLGPNQKSLLLPNLPKINNCNCGKQIDLQAKQCEPCYWLSSRKFNPTKEELENTLRQFKTMEACARLYKVSSNAIRKRCHNYGIQFNLLLGLNAL